MTKLYIHISHDLLATTFTPGMRKKPPEFPPAVLTEGQGLLWRIISGRAWGDPEIVPVTPDKRHDGHVEVFLAKVNRALGDGRIVAHMFDTTDPERWRLMVNFRMGTAGDQGRIEYYEGY